MPPSGIGVTEEPCPDAVNEDNGCIYLGILSDLTEGPSSLMTRPWLKRRWSRRMRLSPRSGTALSKGRIES